MARLIYSAIASLDGYVADESGRFDWAAPSEEVHRFVNDLERPIGTYLYGRRMYETMAYWETAAAGDDPSDVATDYATIWRAARKIVYSTTLTTTSSSRTTIEPRFDAATVAGLKTSETADLSIGGPGLAAHALAAGLVDDLHVFITPVVVGGGTAFLPPQVRLELETVEENRFTDGVVHVHYRVSN
jgi:dihydrofolate reductase